MSGFSSSRMPHQTSTPETTPEGVSGGSEVEQPYGNAAAAEAVAGGAADESGSAEGSNPGRGRGGVRAGAPSTKAGALARHRRNIAKIDRMFRSAAAQTPDPTQGVSSRVNQLKNSVEWITAGNADCFVLTPTHDAHLRPTVAPGQQSYFDNRKKYDEAGADYDATLDASGNATNDGGIEIDAASVVGGMSGGTTLTLMDPSAHSESYLAETIIHEVQHDADQSETGGNWAATRPPADPGATTRAPSWAFNNYQSELRAYWIESPEGSAGDSFGSSTDNAVTNFAVTAVAAGADGAIGGGDDVSKTVNTAFSNVRQEDIFNQLYESQPDNVHWDPASNSWRGSYSYLPHYYALDPAYKSMVDAFTSPEGGNLINSVRIQSLSEAIAAGGPIDVPLDELDPVDLNYLSDRTQSQSFWDQVDNSGLSDAEKQRIRDHVDANVTTEPTPHEVVVVRGDNLHDIASRYLFDARRWRDIYRLNERVIGDDPDLIRPGQRLTLPES